MPESLLVKKGEFFDEMHIIDSKARSVSVSAGWQNRLPRRQHRCEKPPLNISNPKEDKLDFILLLYIVFAEYMSIRLKATSDELIAVKKKSRT
jgi:CRP/FNR family cyclic AMP-dependent transcriptional regulator